VNKTANIINLSVIIVVVLGVMKTVLKDNALPSIRFFFGAGVMWIFLSGLAELEEDIAKTLALVIATIVVLRDAGDVFGSYLGGSAANLGLSPTDAQALKHTTSATTPKPGGVIQGRRPALPGTVMAQPGTFPTRP